MKTNYAHIDTVLVYYVCFDCEPLQDGSVSPAMASSLIDPLQMALLNGSTTETGDLNACYENSYISLAKFVDRSLDCYKVGFDISNQDRGQAYFYECAVFKMGLIFEAKLGF